MTGIHDVFPADNNDLNDPISEKKLKQLDGEYATTKTILGFDFDGLAKMLWLEDAKRAHLLTVLHGWLHSSRTGTGGNPFKEFKSVIAKIRHAFTAIPAGRGILTPCNKMLQMKPPVVYLHWNAVLLAAVAVIMSDCCLQGIKPCEWKGKGYQWVGNQVFRQLD